MHERIILSIAMAAISIGLLLTTGCDDEPAGILLDVRARTMMSNLKVYVKQYHPDKTVTIYNEEDLTIDANEDSYLVTVGGDPIRIDITLPNKGDYAIHLVGTPLDNPDDRLIADVCEVVDGYVHSPDVLLGRLIPELDEDGDTFPESVDAFCDYQSANDGRCDRTCASTAWLSMQDCNPSDGYEFPEHCPSDLDPDNEWNPFVIETCGDCHDQDCWNGDARCEDRDGDGSPSNIDCDDDDPSVHPGAEEICGNEIDDNCNIDIAACLDGDVPCDEDGDEYRAMDERFEGCGTDCDDTNPDVNPSVFEGYGADPDNPLIAYNCDDGVDNNCDGQIDERCSNDFDGDGVERADDCNDCNAAVGIGFLEHCENGVDEDCNGTDLACGAEDSDGDGVDAVPFGSDCDDSDPMIYPGAPDLCGDGINSNCSIDIVCADITDVDGDGFGATIDDCNDEVAAINPWAVERCLDDGVDDDCDGQVNEVPTEDAHRIGCGFEPSLSAWIEFSYENSMDHCGMCHHACQIGNWHDEGDVCSGGECICLGEGVAGGEPCLGGPTSYCCDGGCRDITSDETNCGECERSCVFGEDCRPRGSDRVGDCHCDWAGGIACDITLYDACCETGGCVNTDTDPRNCGGCDNDCVADELGDRCDPSQGGCLCGDRLEVCVGNQLCTEVTQPPLGLATCGCQDLMTSTEHCGRCNAPCSDDREICRGGGCFCVAAGRDCAGPPGEVCCPDGCVNTDEDERNCGGCGNRCAPGEICEAGECRCGGGVGCLLSFQVCCSGVCRDVLTDEANCGPDYDLTACGNACRPGVECEPNAARIEDATSGNCACGAGGDCGDSETCCDNSYCVNLDTSFNNCGECGRTCNPGEECSGGECVCLPGCPDSDGCTEDTCVAGRCEHHTLDADNDGYCAEGCPDSESGEPGDCEHGDGDCDDSRPGVNPGASETCDTPYDDNCDDNTNDNGAVNCTIYYRDDDDDGYGQDGRTRCRCAPADPFTALEGGDCNDGLSSVNPGRSEACNGVDDDCDPATPDGRDECTGGEAYCCGSTPSCRTCCTDGQCPGDHPDCVGYSCTCAEGYQSCGGTCNCNTGGGDVCCGGSCYAGNCCTNANCTAPETCGGGGTAHVCGCTPTTCAAEGYECGTPPDGCGGYLNCGTCSGVESCGGGGTDYVCGCTPTTCGAEGYECGSPPDGCGGTLSCGGCTSPETCGGDGRDYQCGCTPTTCGAEGYECGSPPDGCGGTLSCGGCTSPDVCDGSFQCTCTPDTCGSGGYECGAPPDGCGGTLSCGGCTSPETCGGGGTSYECGCTPDTCASEGYECGTPPDGCGGSLDCGGCTGDDYCDGSYQCICTPTTCGDEGWECGTPDDGCGTALNCGTCSNDRATDCQTDNTCGCDANGGAPCNTNECCCSDGCHSPGECPC